MIPYMVGKLAPNSSHLTRGLVKYFPGRGYFRAVSSQNGDKVVTSPPAPPIVERVGQFFKMSSRTSWNLLLGLSMRFKSPFTLLRKMTHTGEWRHETACLCVPEILACVRAHTCGFLQKSFFSIFFLWRNNALTSMSCTPTRSTHDHAPGWVRRWRININSFTPCLASSSDPSLPLIPRKTMRLPSQTESFRQILCLLGSTKAHRIRRTGTMAFLLMGRLQTLKRRFPLVVELSTLTDLLLLEPRRVNMRTTLAQTDCLSTSGAANLQYLR